MTDREAIRRLAEIIEYGLKGTTMSRDATALLNDLAEPAAPTVKQGDACRHGTVVNCSCEFGRGYEQARLDITSDSLKTIQHPTVTREQAEWVSDVIQTKWYDIRAKQDDEREAPPVRYEMPAFFRAVADALEREA